MLYSYRAIIVRSGGLILSHDLAQLSLNKNSRHIFNFFTLRRQTIVKISMPGAHWKPSLFSGVHDDIFHKCLSEAQDIMHILGQKCAPGRNWPSKRFYEIIASRWGWTKLLWDIARKHINHNSCHKFRSSILIIIILKILAKIDLLFGGQTMSIYI